MWQSPARRILPSDVELANSIQRRWIDLARWLRAYIYNVILGIGNREAIERRLSQLADAANSFYERYYNPEIGLSTKMILQNFFVHAKGMAEAYMKNDISLIEQQRYFMYQDAYDFSRLLSGANRYWDAATLQALFYVLVDNTEKQIASIINKNYENEIASYDQFVEQVYRVADELTYGLIKQFSMPG